MTPQDAAALVQANQVHRDLYLSPEVFALEQQHLWGGSWLFVGHDSQVPAAGDYTTSVLAGQPVLMIRGDDGRIAVLHNRCAHKGAPLATDASGPRRPLPALPVPRLGLPAGRPAGRPAGAQRLRRQ